MNDSLVYRQTEKGQQKEIGGKRHTGSVKAIIL